MKIRIKEGNVSEEEVYLPSTLFTVFETKSLTALYGIKRSLEIQRELRAVYSDILENVSFGTVQFTNGKECVSTMKSLRKEILEYNLERTIPIPITTIAIISSDENWDKKDLDTLLSKEGYENITLYAGKNAYKYLGLKAFFKDAIPVTIGNHGGYILNSEEPKQESFGDSKILYNTVRVSSFIPDEVEMKKYIKEINTLKPLLQVQDGKWNYSFWETFRVDKLIALWSKSGFYCSIKRDKYIIPCQYRKKSSPDDKIIKITEIARSRCTLPEDIVFDILTLKNLQYYVLEYAE